MPNNRPTTAACALKQLRLLNSLLQLLTLPLLLLSFSGQTSGVLIAEEVLDDGTRSYPGHSFSHMQLYELRGEEFLAVAQTNQLINMRADFSAQYVTQIGPRNDSTECSPRQMWLNMGLNGIGNPNCKIHSMDNYMKAMTLHNGSLYFCMSYLSSSCAAATLTDGPLSVNFTEIDSKLQDLARSLLCRNREARTHLTVAPKYTGNSPDAKSDNGLYLAMPFCSTKNLDNTVESVISIVELKKLQLFQIGSFSIFHSEILPHNSKRRPNALNYHYSFKYTDGPYEYVYFLLTAREIVTSQFSQVRIGRLCTKDLYMTGYVEMHIYCNHAEADLTANYGYIGEAATFAKAGRQLAASLGIPAEEPVLFLSSRVFDSSLLNWRQGVCAVPISAINARLNRIVLDCLRGQAYFGPAYIRDPVKCSETGSATSLAAASVEEDAPAPPQCTPLPLQPEWRGMVGVKEQHRYTAIFLASLDTSVNITSLAALPLENGATVLYIGTSAGRLLHYSVLSLNRSYLFDYASIDGGAVLSIRTGRRRLYALTRTQVVSRPYASCEQRHLSCSACLGSRNPHCVWSNLAANYGCRTRDRPGQPDPASHVTSADNCPTVDSVNNADICVDKSLTKEKPVSVDVQLRRAPSVTYYCHYRAGGDAVMPSRKAEVLGSYHLGGSLGVRCPVDMSRLRLFLASRASRSWALQITASQASPAPYYASIDAEAFSCHLLSNCTSCSAGGGRRRLCSWCSLRSACVHQPASECPHDVARSAVVNASSGSCPLVSVASGAGDAGEIAQPSGTSARLVYTLSGYQPFMESFSCTVACPGSQPAVFPAKLLEVVPSLGSSASRHRQLECRTGILQQLSAATLRCSVVFHWSDVSGGKFAIESAVPSVGRLLLYQCQLMASSCDDCTLGIRDERFSCVWCPRTGSCTAEDRCPAGGGAAAVKRGGLCPDPLIRLVRPPKLDPYAGLRLRVTGSNLGNSWDSLSAVLQAEVGSGNLKCSVQSDVYIPGKSFDCLLEDMPLLGTRYRLLVSLPGLARDDVAVVSSSWLTVARPALTGLSGSGKAQQNGLAEVRLLGSDLDAGSDLQVTMLSDQFMPVPAEVLSRASGHAIVRLGRFHRPGRYFASLMLRNQSDSMVSHRPAQLEVLPDAELSLSSESALRTGLIPAGGLGFELPGNRLDAVTRPVIELRQLDNPDESRRIVGECRALQSKSLVCWSPQLPPPELRRRRSSGSGNNSSSSPPSARFSATIFLDSLEHPYPANLTLFPDPVLHPLGAVKVQLLQDWRRLGRLELQITGRNLRPGLQLSDIAILVGQQPCLVAALESPSGMSGDRLTCRHQLPESAISVQLPISGKIGRLRFDLGHVTYSPQFKWTYVYAGGSAALALVFVLIIACLVRAHRQARRRQEKSSHIEVQINLLEAQVSQNCRDAFAELQLNSCGLGDRKGGMMDEWRAPVPVRSFTEFASFSCFADRYKDRHKTQDPLFTDVLTPEAAAAAMAAEPPEVRKALGQLHNLLLNEDFLVIMINAMESRSDRFMNQERSHFGSLLSALLYSDIAYFTRILSRLIESLVNRRQEANDNYKVVFRRCDSVAERLLPNWLAFLMYEHLNRRVAGPLHRLYWAMRQQIYKGPVDQITGDSKYTINEQKLLKKEIPFKELTLTFQDRLRVFSTEQQQVQCSVSVLDCDTVHQAKEKILDAVYTQLGLPYSQRVPATQFDLARTFRGTAGGGGIGGSGEENSNERYLILTEIDNSADHADEGLQRLRRLDSFNLDGADQQSGSNADPSIVVFLKPRKEPPRVNGSAATAAAAAAVTAPRRSKGATLMGAFGDSSSQQASCNSSWRSLQDGGSSGGGKSWSAAAAGGCGESDKRHYHLLLPSGADGQSLLSSGNGGGSGKKKSKQQQRDKRSGRSEPTVDGQHIVSEVFYPVLLRTKRLLTDKITDLFSALFPAPKSELLQPEQDKEVPLCLKYLFDLFDKVVRERQLTHDVAHVWKSNALMLRFFTHHLFNVDYLLDVEVPGPVRYCMSTVSTLFMDACSYEKPAKPDKNSTAQRLLFVNEVAEFHPLVEAYYSTVRSGLQEAEAYALSQFEQQVRQRQCAPFNRDALLRELFAGFLCKYREEIINELQQQQPSLSASLSDSLDFVFQALSNASPYWSKAHTLSSTQSQHSRQRPHPVLINPYEPAAC